MNTIRNIQQTLCPKGDIANVGSFPCRSSKVSNVHQLHSVSTAPAPRWHPCSRPITLDTQAGSVVDDGTKINALNDIAIETV